jgi:hypothetical protein
MDGWLNSCSRRQDEYEPLIQVPRGSNPWCHSALKQFYSLDPVSVCRQLLGQKVWFVGDSISALAFESLVLLTGHQIKDSSRGWTKVDVCDGSTEIGYVRNDHLVEIQGNRHSDGPFWSTMANADVLIANTGAHWIPDVEFLSNVRTFVHNLREKLPRAEVYWRSTVPGHVNCRDFTAPLGAPQSLTPLNNPYHWELIQHQNELARAVMASAGVRWVDAYELSILRADLHQVASSDCLHYCLPGPPDDWNRLWLLMRDQDHRSSITELESEPDSG